MCPRTISKEAREFVMERDSYTCQMCGYGPGDADPYRPGAKVRLVMGHVVDTLKEGRDTANNLRVICTNCSEGLQAVKLPKPTQIQLMKQLRRATIDDQLYALDWLERKFSNIRPPKQK